MALGIQLLTSWVISTVMGWIPSTEIVIKCISGNFIFKDDFSLDGGVGSCGKEGQTIPVGVGQPSLKISEITVGGTS